MLRGNTWYCLIREVPALFSSCRFFGSPCGRRWMDFDAAKDVVRSHNFSSSGEFKTWLRCGMRPPGFPYHPERIYLEKGWNGFPDFLGYERQRHSLRELTERQTKSREVGLQKFRSLADGIDYATEWVVRADPTLVCMRLPRGSAATLLFRSRQDGDEFSGNFDQWCTNPNGNWWGVRVRVGTYVYPEGRVCFRARSKGEEPSQMGVICVNLRLNILRAFSLEDLRYDHASWTLAHQAPKAISADPETHLRAFLTAWKSDCVPKPWVHWLLGKRGKGPSNVPRSHIEALKTQVLDPAGIHLTFPREDQFSWNMLFCGKRVLHRFASPIAKKKGMYVNFNRADGYRRYVPFDLERDLMDVILISIGEGDTSPGVFVFSREDIKKCFSFPGHAGMKSLFVYLPWETPSGEAAKLTKAAQIERFVDFRKSPYEYVPKFLELLKMASRDHDVPADHVRLENQN